MHKFSFVPLMVEEPILWFIFVPQIVEVQIYSFFFASIQKNFIIVFSSSFFMFTILDFRSTSFLQIFCTPVCFPIGLKSAWSTSDCQNMKSTLRYACVAPGRVYTLGPELQPMCLHLGLCYMVPSNTLSYRSGYGETISMKIICKPPFSF